jgi:hypothetical protein
MDYLNLLQWPATLVTVGAAWLVGSHSAARRGIGFWLFLLSNALWIAWALHASAYALILLQFCLAIMNVRGAAKNDAASSNRGSVGTDAPVAHDQPSTQAAIATADST